jgi:hypothetical protein
MQVLWSGEFDQAAPENRVIHNAGIAQRRAGLHLTNETARPTTKAPHLPWLADEVL